MSAYSSNYVVSVIGPSGTPLREHNDLGLRTARLPFGSEYKLRLKNKSILRALVEVWIDGTCCTPESLILPAGQTLDLERFLSNGSLSEGPRFKFVSTQQAARDGSLQDPDSPLNGQIRVVFRPELLSSSTFLTTGVTQITAPYYPFLHNTFYSAVNSTTPSSSAVNSTTPSSSDRGGTAEGSGSSQTFQHAASFFTGNPVEIEIWMKGPEAQPRTPWEVEMRPEGPVVYLGGVPVGSVGSVEFTSEGGLVLRIPTYQLRR